MPAMFREFSFDVAETRHQQINTSSGAEGAPATCTPARAARKSVALMRMRRAMPERVWR